MSDIYASLEVSPKKKRCPPIDDDTIFTPKKLRTAPPTPPPTSSRRAKGRTELPDHLTRLYNIQTALQHALSHALATCAVSPTSDTGIVRNVLNHLSLTTYTGLTSKFEVDDLSRLCWIWEWDAKSLPSDKKKDVATTDEEENPFLVSPPSPGVSASGEWTRGGMGLVLSPTTHHSKRDGKRVPAYGVGIEVEMDVDKDMGGGMAAVARWTAAAETRRSEFHDKLKRWTRLHSNAPSVPPIPLAGLPELALPTKISALTRTLASASPKGAISSLSLPGLPSSPSRSPTKSPSKRALRDFAVPFPITSASKSPTKSSVLFPQTPSRRDKVTDLFSPRTPATSITSESAFNPSTPVHQKGDKAPTVPQTPTSSRRQALYERVRQKSLSASPTKSASSAAKSGKLTRDQMMKMGQDELRRRCLLGRLGGVAESVWMLFSTPATGSSATPSARKRRALPTSQVATAVIKSSPVPISAAEANESLSMLAKLCPFFIKELNIAGEEWLEMPASNPASTGGNVEGSPSKKPAAPPSPGPAIKGKHESAEELVTRSPRRVKREGGGLREVREIIRRELELSD
ncbi:putative DNA replication factor Cdt1 C-terminal domain [Lyophyllum shimeji]|uniref:DNA replication factor Cdt1 C-terminal domain n=1 Tax=Lyophyllum shimeji TaxID=47721 RepID=A0A9P3PD71_LYOSH|nr:putative DNA replication factor Cdt1 C-terminal domain [Lyophyllum shimeji]